MKVYPNKTNSPTIKEAKMNQNYKKSVRVPCPHCKQSMKTEIDVPVPKEGIEFFVAHNTDGTADLTVMYHRPIKKADAGTMVYTSMPKAVIDRLIVGLGQKHHADNTTLVVHETNKLTKSIHNRRHTLRLTSVLKDDSFDVVKKLRRQNKELWER